MSHLGCIPVHRVLRCPRDRVNPARGPRGFGRMGEDSRIPPLSRRVPGATDRDRAKPIPRALPRKLPEALLQRMQAAVDAAQEQAALQEQAAALPWRAPRSALPASFLARISAPEAVTQPIPVISGSVSRGILSPATEEISAQPEPEVVEPQPEAAQPEPAPEPEPKVAEPERAVEPSADHDSATVMPGPAGRPAQKQVSGRKVPVGRRYRLVGVFATVTILLAAGFALSRHAATPGDGHVPASATGDGHVPAST